MGLKKEVITMSNFSITLYPTNGQVQPAALPQNNNHAAPLSSQARLRQEAARNVGLTETQENAFVQNFSAIDYFSQNIRTQLLAEFNDLIM
jgi:hypothetical protein